MKEKYYIVVPVYNEERIITAVIKEIKKAGYKNIIAVDDGSTDNTFKELKKNKLIALKHIINRGKGAAAKTGFEAAKILNATVVITMDGDGQHNPKNIDTMLKSLRKGYDVVLGSRFIKHNNVPLLKRLANQCGNLFTWIAYGLWVNDSQSGFRAYNSIALKKITTKHDKYEFDSEIIREIARNKLKFVEIPIEVRYTKYSMSKLQKQSFINGLRTLLRILISNQ